jgi:deoxyribodipyrimidine photolyase
MSGSRRLYVRRWAPELREFPARLIHQPRTTTPRSSLPARASLSTICESAIVGASTTLGDAMDDDKSIVQTATDAVSSAASATTAAAKTVAKKVKKAAKKYAKKVTPKKKKKKAGKKPPAKKSKKYAKKKKKKSKR